MLKHFLYIKLHINYCQLIMQRRLKLPLTINKILLNQKKTLDLIVCGGGT